MAKTRIGSVACLLVCCCWWSVATAGRFDKYPHETVTDPTRNYLPGKYYERVALEDVRHKDYTGALNAYQRAAYWGNKVAQYDLGEVYLHGMGRIRADPARGVAWLGIADEEHEPDYDKALVSAYKSLKPEERKRAEGLWKELQEKYADKLTLARATRLSRMPTIPDAPVPPPPKVTPTRTPSRSTVTIPPVTSRTRRSWSLT